MAEVINFPTLKTYQLKITLNDIVPEIWRKFQVSSKTLLPDLHKIIQTIMGWTNSHLHQFIIDDKYYCEPHEESSSEDIDYTKIILGSVLHKEGDQMVYEYDFGDGWEHQIILEKIIDTKEEIHPFCITGERNCPPEDCGGPFGYVDLLKIISDSNHPEYEELNDWLGDGFDSEYFDLIKINELLRIDDFGCIILD